MILTSTQIKALDNLVMSEQKITEYELVKMAARGILLALKDDGERLSGSKILVICGPGLNGADGLCLADMLSKICTIVKVLPVDLNKYCDVASIYYNECIENNIETVDTISNEYDIIIDAVYGIGFHKTLDEILISLFNKALKTQAFKISIDVPSGVYTDNSLVASGAFMADLTVAVSAKKPCHVFYPARENCNRTIVANIGVDDTLIYKSNPYIYEINRYEHKNIIKQRSNALHKGNFGRAGLVVGSVPYRGAAVLAVKSALRCGVGLAFAYIPDAIYGTFYANCISAVIKPMKSRGGTICDKSLSRQLDGCTAVICGCGLGLSKGAEMAVADVLSKDIPVVIDADAITIISRRPELLNRNAVTIITPHVGEFAKLCNKTVDEVVAQRLTLAMQYSKANKCVLLLKDSVSVVAFPDGHVYVLSQPTSALSKGGSGDVLAGMICSFLAQGYDEKSAVIAAVSLHNECGHLAQAEFGSFSTLPDDIINAIPSLMKTI